MRRMIPPEIIKELENGDISINNGAVIVKPDGTVEIGKDAVVDGNVKVNAVENLTDMDGTPLEFGGGGGKLYKHTISNADSSYNEVEFVYYSTSDTAIPFASYPKFAFDSRIIGIYRDLNTSMRYPIQVVTYGAGTITIELLGKSENNQIVFTLQSTEYYDDVQEL